MQEQPQRVELDGASVTFRDDGRGAPLLFVHGYSWPLDEVRRQLGISAPSPYVPIPPTGEAPRLLDLLRASVVRDPGAALAS